MHRIAAVLNLLTQLNKLSSNNFIRHECQNGILGGCFFILFDGYIITREPLFYTHAVLFCNIGRNGLNSGVLQCYTHKSSYTINYLSKRKEPPSLRKRFFINLYSAYIGWIIFLLSSSLPLMPTRSFLLFWKKSIATFGNCA